MSKNSINDVSNLNIELTNNQLEQINEIAKNRYGLKHTVCEKHPEWSPNFMNYIIQREHREQPLYLEEVVPFLKNNMLPKDKRTSTIGNDLDVVHDLYDILSNGTHSLPIIIDECNSVSLRYQLLKSTISAKDAIPQRGYRVQINDHMNNLKLLMSEGIEEAYDILSRLQSAAVNNTKNQTMDRWEIMADRMFEIQNVLLTLDDMNIRGQQIIDALEYAGSIPALYKMLDGVRSQPLVDWCNDKAATRILDGKSEKEHIATLSGASFAHNKINTDCISNSSQYVMRYNNTRDYKSNIKPHVIDYSAMDLEAGITMEEGIQICEAHGFKLYIDIPENEDEHHMFFYNTETGDYITSHSKPNNFQYGWANCYVFRKERGPVGIGCTSMPNKEANLFYHQISGADRNLFEKYSKFEGTALDLYDPRELGWGYKGNQIPQMKHIHLFANQEDIFWDKVGHEHYDSLFTYNIQKLVNWIQFMPYAEKIDIPIFAGYRGWIVNNLMGEIVSTYKLNLGCAALCVALAKHHLNVPKHICDAWCNQVKEICQQYDSKNSQSVDNFTKITQGNQHKYNAFEELLARYDSKDFVNEIVDILKLSPTATKSFDTREQNKQELCQTNMRDTIEYSI